MTVEQHLEAIDFPIARRAGDDQQLYCPDRQAIAILRESPNAMDSFEPC